MVSLSTSGNSIIFTFENSQHYLYGNGQVECPKNSLILVTDSSEMATFKKAASNDIFISATYSELGMTKSELISYYEDNMVGSTGGSESGITSGDVQSMIDESISGLAESSAVTLEISEATSGKADSSAVTEEISAATSGLQETLVSGTNIKTINNESILGSGNITIQGGGSEASSAITSGDTNPVQGGAVYDALDIIEQVTARALTDLNSNKADTSAVTEAISAATSGLVSTSDVTSAVTSASTDSEIPTAKAVWDVASQGGGGTTYSAGTNIDITNDTISCTLPISAGTGTNSIIGGYPHNTATNKGSIALGGWYDSAYSYGFCNASGKGAVSLGGDASGDDSFTAAGIGNAKGARSAAIATYGSEAKGIESFAIGRGTTANTHASFAQGRYTKTTNEAEVALGEFNNSVSGSSTFGNSGNTLFSVGNGTADNARHNAFEIRQNGDMYLNNGTSDVKLQDYLQIKVVKLTQQEYDALVSGGTVDNNTLYVIT